MLSCKEKQKSVSQSDRGQVNSMDKLLKLTESDTAMATLALPVTSSGFGQLGSNVSQSTYSSNHDGIGCCYC